MSDPLRAVRVDPAQQGARAGLAGWRLDALFGLALLLLSGLLVQHYSSYPAARYALTAAAVDDHTLELDRYEPFLSRDRAEYRGHTYSHVAPYQPLLAAPVYQAYRWAGGTAFPIVNGRYDLFGGVLRGVWWVTLWSSTIPSIALLIVLRRLIATVDPLLATRVAVGIVAGTTILPFTSLLFGHILAALAVTAAWWLLRPRAPGWRAGALAGLWLGFGIGTEYPVAVIAGILLVMTLAARRWREALAMSVGTIVACLPMFLYHYLVFESPFDTAYQGHLSAAFEGEGAFGVYNLQMPRLSEVAKALVGDRGLLLLTPVMALAVAGCILAIWHQRPTRRDAWLALAALATMIVVSTGIDGYGGSSPGPRYLIPILPLFAIPLVEAWLRSPFLASGTEIVGATSMVVCTITDPQEGPTPIDWYQDLFSGAVAPTVFGTTGWGWVVYLAAAASVGVACFALHGDRVWHLAAPGTAIAAVSPAVE